MQLRFTRKTARRTEAVCPSPRQLLARYMPTPCPEGTPPQRWRGCGGGWGVSSALSGAAGPMAKNERAQRCSRTPI